MVLAGVSGLARHADRTRVSADEGGSDGYSGGGSGSAGPERTLTESQRGILH